MANVEKALRRDLSTVLDSRRKWVARWRKLRALVSETERERDEARAEVKAWEWRTAFLIVEGIPDDLRDSAVTDGDDAAKLIDEKMLAAGEDDGDWGDYWRLSAPHLARAPQPPKGGE